jgi:hypothetical protein
MAPCAKEDAMHDRQEPDKQSPDGTAGAGNAPTRNPAVRDHAQARGCPDDSDLAPSHAALPLHAAAGWERLAHAAHPDDAEDASDIGLDRDRAGGSLHARPGTKEIETLSDLQAKDGPTYGLYPFQGTSMLTQAPQPSSFDMMPFVSARMRMNTMDYLFQATGGAERAKDWIEENDDNYKEFFRLWARGASKSSTTEIHASESVEAILSRLDAGDSARVINAAASWGEDTKDDDEA